MTQQSRFSWRGLVPQFFILIILPLTAVLLVVTFGGLALHRQAMRTMVGERDERAVRAAAHALSDQLDQQVDEIRVLAVNAQEDASPEELSRLLQAHDFLLADFDRGMAFFSPEGELLASAGNIEEWGNPAALQESGLQTALDPMSPPSLHSFTLGDGTNLLFAVVSVGRAGPVAVGTFSPQDFIADTLEYIFDPTSGTSAFLVTGSGQLLFSVGEVHEEADLAKHPGVEPAISGRSGSTFLESGREEHVAAYSPVEPLGWALVIEEPWASLASPLLVTTEYAPLVLIPVVVLAVVALWFVTRWIIQPLQGLEAKANELAWGNYDAIDPPTGGVAEIQHLESAMVHLAHKVKTYQQGLRGYIGAITMGQEEERRRLARELHDDTLQSLIALNQRVQLAQLAYEEQTERASLEEIQSLAEETIQNLRRFTRALRPIYLEDLGLSAALEMLIRETQQRTAMDVIFERIGAEVRLSAPVELALYRIGQEALSNIVRHAEATHASLKICYAPDSVSLEVRDNGVGFVVPESPAEFAPSGHFGLLGIQERAEMIGADLNLESGPEEGSQLTVTVPIQNVEE